VGFFGFSNIYINNVLVMKKKIVITEEEVKSILNKHKNLKESVEVTDVITSDIPSDSKNLKKFIKFLNGNVDLDVILNDIKLIDVKLLDAPKDTTIDGGSKVTEKGGKLLNNPIFKKKLSEISDAINISENSIIKLMKHESGLDPRIKNSIGCVGLIQFCPSGGPVKTVNGKQYTLEDLRDNLEVQMEAIKQFWLSGYEKGKIKKPADLYIYNFFPVAAGKPDDFIIQAKGLSATKVANANPVFNRVLGREKSAPLTVGLLNQYYQKTGMI
jgi:hypothetical protein